MKNESVARSPVSWLQTLKNLILSLSLAALSLGLLIPAVSTRADERGRSADPFAIPTFHWRL